MDEIAVRDRPPDPLPCHTSPLGPLPPPLAATRSLRPHPSATDKTGRAWRRARDALVAGRSRATRERAWQGMRGAAAPGRAARLARDVTLWVGELGSNCVRVVVRAQVDTCSIRSSLAGHPLGPLLLRSAASAVHSGLPVLVREL